MSGKKPGIYWRFCWSVATPVLMIVILIYSLVNMEPEKYNNQFFPTGAYGNITNSFIFLLECIKTVMCCRVIEQVTVKSPCS